MALLFHLFMPQRNLHKLTHDYSVTFEQKLDLYWCQERSWYLILVHYYQINCLLWSFMLAHLTRFLINNKYINYFTEVPWSNFILLLATSFSNTSICLKVLFFTLMFKPLLFTLHAAFSFFPLKLCCVKLN